MANDLQMIFRVFATPSERALSLDTEGRPAMLFVEKGVVTIEGNAVWPGDGAYLPGDEARSVRCDGRIAVWTLGQASARIPDYAELQMPVPIDLRRGTSLFRLDTVGFPPGARAYRHVHPGPGIRYLVEGELEIQGDGLPRTIAAGQPWFEAANSPVTATCRQDRASRFVRAHLLPPDYMGKPSIRYLDDADLDKPKLQTTHRLCEHLVDL